MISSGATKNIIHTRQRDILQRLYETTAPFRSRLRTIKHGGHDFIRVIGGGSDVGDDDDGGKGNFC